MRASFDNSNQQSLQAQLAQLQAQADTNGRSGYGFDRNLNDRITQLQAQMNAEAMKANSASAGAGQDELAKSRAKILDYTAGRGDAAMNDAMTNAALGRLDKVSSGADAPFTLAVQNQQLAQQAGMNATSAGSQAEMLRQQAAGLGGSIADPSYQARLRQIESQRQSSNADAQGQIQTTAQLQNFGARQTGTNSLLSGRMGQMGLANSQYNQAADFLRNDSQTGQHQGAVTQPFMYNFAQSANPAQGYNYQTPPIQYQQYNTAQQPASGGQSAGIMQGPAPTPQTQPIMHTNNGGYGQPGAYQQPQPYPQKPMMYNFNLPQSYQTGSVA